MFQQATLVFTNRLYLYNTCWSAHHSLCNMLGTWMSLVEMAALRRDAVTFVSLMQTVPRLGRLALDHDVDNAQYKYWLRLFDTVDYNRDMVKYRRWGRLHRDYGLPAIETKNGGCSYYVFGKLLRETKRVGTRYGDTMKFHRVIGEGISNRFGDDWRRQMGGRGGQRNMSSVKWQSVLDETQGLYYVDT